MNNFAYPIGTSQVIRINSLNRHLTSATLSELLSTRMVKSAAQLPEGEFLGWQMRIPINGITDIDLFGSASVNVDDLEWMSEKTGKTTHIKVTANKATQTGGILYELCCPLQGCASTRSIGFGADVTGASENGNLRWPMVISLNFGEVVKSLRVHGAYLRVCVGSASQEEIKRCREFVRKTWTGSGKVEEYIGNPVKCRVLFILPQVPGLQFRTILDEAIPGAMLRHVGTISDSHALQMWCDPLVNASVLPDFAARSMMLEPYIGKEPVSSIRTHDEPIELLPYSHSISKDVKGIKIGNAIDMAGIRRQITIGEVDMRRHWQIIGQTGTGKSTLLACTVIEAIKKGYGLTFFDPHGTTINTILRTVPPEYAGRIRVVRIGDENNPVPINIWSSDDPEKEERTISELGTLFAEIFDPTHQGYLGPRWEHIFSLFAKATIAFYGRRASFESIYTIAPSKKYTEQLSKRIQEKYPLLSQELYDEFVSNRGSDYQEVMNWFVCKFQRLTCVPQLRSTLGGGANALNFAATVDTDTITLIDLASPAIGTNAARVVGTLLLMQLWSAILSRKARDKTHLVFIDEAHLFQSDPLPQMLAEGRKFGLGLILAHQHCGQLTSSVREALEANSANFSAFRLSPKDALSAAARIDQTDYLSKLCRLDAFNAVSTISVAGFQTEPFTLRVSKPKLQGDGEKIAQKIEEDSIATLVKPFCDQRALTKQEILDALFAPPKKELSVPKVSTDLPHFMKRWIDACDDLRDDELFLVDPDDDSGMTFEENDGEEVAPYAV